MDEAEYDKSSFGIAANGWQSYMRQVVDYNNLVRMLMRLIPQVSLTQSLVERTPLARNRRVKLTGRALAVGKGEMKGEYEFTHTLILMAAWGAFDAFVTDVCRAMLMMNAQLLEGKPFEGAKVPVALLFKEPGKRVTAAYDHAVARLKTDSRASDKQSFGGVGKFEAQLGMVGLANAGGDISDELGRAILHAQQIRHVWAHRGGKADVQLLSKCPSLDFELCSTVRISTDQHVENCNALMVYGLLIINRFRAQQGLPLKPFPGSHEMPLADPYATYWGAAR